MSRKVYVNVTVRVIFDLEDSVELDAVISEMDYNFKSNTPDADILDTEINDYEVIDSK